MIRARHVVVNVTSRLTRLQGETRVDICLRGRWRNIPLHSSLILAGDFRSHKLKVNILHVSVMFGMEVLDEVIGNIFSSLLPVEAKSVF